MSELFAAFCIGGVILGAYKTIRMHNDMLELQDRWHKAYWDYLTTLSKTIGKWNG